MLQRLARAAGISAVTVATALGGAAPALAAKHHRHHHRAHARQHASNTTSSSSTSSTTQSNGNGETPLTGSTLASASAAAIAANPGATVDSAGTESDRSISGAVYEVHITKTDGSHAVVIEDSSFNVLATQTGDGCSHGGGAAT
jgi:uncharacterized membrane protein YkoI